MRGGKKEREHVKKRVGKRVEAETKRDPSLIVHKKPTEHLAAQSVMPQSFRIFFSNR